MIFSRIATAISMIFRILSRQKIVLILIFLIPLFFFCLVHITSSENLLPVTLASLEEEEVFLQPERQISLVYYAIASCGFLVSFLALYLTQQNHLVNKRLVMCGYRSTEILISNLVSMLIIILVIASYIGVLIQFFHPYENIFGLILGLCMIGFVYGCYGLLTGSLLKGELEGILMIVLLANIDVGWLQNPVFYSQSKNQEFIQWLPGFYPSQASILQVFTEFSSLNEVLFSLLYGLVLLTIAIMLFFYKMRLFRTKS